ncbi:hypothetical protein [Methylobacterium gossipiicola]|uniref:SMI1/KNR4 family protein n=1 Tax=Methylobacterium gossipiicola TaxID=582675 RepID=A0A1I2VGV1_9HYPH|nr:hypothetical protein [Methylobacterium gossipiicola]SFG88555.1 hypothetical protein SAMN05192565_11528 [Methylobacterium gossipiicola]
MSRFDTTAEAVRVVLAPFGALRPQFPADWNGEIALHPSLIRFYGEVGPYGEDGPHGPDGLTIPTTGNAFAIPPLARLWEGQAGYRWHGLTGKRLAGWRDEWLVVADQGGDPFILDGTTGAVLHAHHGGGAWEPEPIFADVFAMALVLGTIGAVHEEGGEGLYDEEFEVRPAWRAVLRARLAPSVGETEADSIASRFGW